MHAAANQLHGKGSLFTPFAIVRLALRCTLLCLFLLPRAQKVGSMAFASTAWALPESAASFSHMNARTRSCSMPLPWHTACRDWLAPERFSTLLPDRPAHGFSIISSHPSSLAVHQGPARTAPLHGPMLAIACTCSGVWLAGDAACNPSLHADSTTQASIKITYAFLHHINVLLSHARCVIRTPYLMKKFLP